MSFTHEDLDMLDDLTNSLRKAANRDDRRNLYRHAYYRRAVANKWDDLRDRIAEHVPADEDEANGHGTLGVTLEPV